LENTMPKLKVKSQLPFVEKNGWVDDCGPTGLAMAVAWASGYEIDPTVQEAISAAAKAGRVDVNGQGNPTTFKQLIAAAKTLGAKARYAKSWEDVVAAAKAGAAIGINVQAPKNYPEAALAVNAFARKRVGKSTYGHYTCAVWDAELGWQFADPTQTGKGKEKNAALLTEKQVKALAASKGDKAGPHARCLIFTYAKKAKAASPAPVTAEPAAAVVEPIVSTPAKEEAAPLPIISPESPLTPAILIDDRPRRPGPVRKPLGSAPSSKPVAPKMPQAARPGITIDWAAFVLAIFKKITGRS
jgi:hypothetical protein